MKVPLSVRRMYEERLAKYDRLKEEVDGLIRNRKKASWHYQSRLKSLESFAIKLESGRWESEGSFDDLLAAVIVVENLMTLRDAEDLVRRYFAVRERRPSAPGQTTTRADSFPFDDVRLYVEWPPDAPVPKPMYAGLVLEIQLRTFLQHAWNIATHDVVYKSKRKDWSMDRLASQVRAGLEHADITLCEIDRLRHSQALARVDGYTQRLNDIATLLERHWEDGRLPEDLKGLTSNVDRLMRSTKLSVERIDSAIQAEREAGGGSLPQNLSPFGVIAQALLRRERDAMRRLLTRERRGFTIWIPAEVQVPEDIDPCGFRNVIVLHGDGRV